MKLFKLINNLNNYNLKFISSYLYKYAWIYPFRASPSTLFVDIIYKNFCQKRLDICKKLYNLVKIDKKLLKVGCAM